MTKPFCYVTDTNKIIKPGVLDQYSSKAAAVTQDGSKQATPDIFTNAYSEHGLIEPPYPPTYLTNLSSLNTHHNRCVKTKALDVAGNGYTLNPVGDAPNESNRGKLKEFFDQLPPDIWQSCHQDVEEIGYGAVELIRYGDTSDGEPQSLVHIPAHTIRVHKDFKKFMQLRGTDQAWFKLVDTEGEIDSKTGTPLDESIPELLEQEAKVRANEVLFYKTYSTASDYYGLPDIVPAIGAVYGDKSRNDYNISFFQNYGIPTYAVTISGDFEDELVDPEDENSLTYLETAIQQHFRNIQSNPHSTLFLSVPSRPGAEGNVDIKFEPLSVETKEASFRLYRTDNRDEIITAHGMDPYRVGITVAGSLGGNTAIESKKNYKTGTVEPRQRLWEDLINKHIIRNGFGIFDWEFRFNNIDVEDDANDLTLMTGLFQLGAVTPNQVIRRFGDRFGLEVGEHPSMDTHYLQGRPLETEEQETDVQTNLDTIQVLESLQKDLVEIANEESDEDGDEDTGLIGRVKNLTRSN